MIFLILLFSTTAEAWTLLRSNLEGWTRRDLPLAVNYDNCTLSEDELNAALDGAIQLWNSVTTSNLTLSRTTSTTTVAEFFGQTATDTPVILCDPNFQSAASAPDPDLIPAYVLPGSNNPLNYAGMILNAEAGGAANIANLSAVILSVVVGHEMGHLLGLGHSQEPSSVMYYSVAGKTELVLSQDDSDGMTFLYPRNEFNGGLYGCAARHRMNSNGKDWVWSFISFLFVLVVSFGIGRWVMVSQKSLR